MKTNPDKALRQHLLYLLKEGGAHAMFEDAIKNFPTKLRGQKAPNFPHTAWMLLEHMRIAQSDILDFSRNPKYKPLKWPADYWPKSPAPPNAAAWDKSIKSFHDDLEAMKKLVGDPKTDLFAKIPWGEGQTVLREAMLLADHNSHHLGQIIDVRRLLGVWK
jgi:hypothetical protein